MPTHITIFIRGLLIPFFSFIDKVEFSCQERAIAFI